MRPIFSCFLFTFIIYFYEIETSNKLTKKEKLEALKLGWKQNIDHVAEIRKKEREDTQKSNIWIEQHNLEKAAELEAKKTLTRLKEKERMDARKHDWKHSKSEKAKKMKKELNAAEIEVRSKQPFKKLLNVLDIHGSPFASAEGSTYGGFATSRTTLRQLAPKSNFQHASNSAPHLSHTPHMNNRLTPFQTMDDRSGGYASEAHTVDYSHFPTFLPHNGANSLNLFEKTVSHHVTSNTYVDNEGYHYQMPNHAPQPPPNIGGDSFTLYENAIGNHAPGSIYMDNQGVHHQTSYHPSALTGNYGYNNLHGLHGQIPLSNPPSLPPFPQNFDSNPLLQSSSEISPSISFPQHQGFHGLPSENYYFSEPHANSDLNQIIGQNYPDQTGGFGYPFQQ